MRKRFGLPALEDCEFLLKERRKKGWSVKTTLFLVIKWRYPALPSEVLLEV